MSDQPDAPDPTTPAAAGDETVLPGVHRGGFQRLPTAPVGVTSTSAPTEPGLGATDTAELLPAWMAVPDAQVRSPRLAAWALGFSIVGLAVALFVGWGFPLAVVGIVTAAIALRRPLESRAVAVWALALGILALVYSAGWLVWAATHGGPHG